ncbi:MAG: L-serine ammonia-lyase, iron-sulfur-dependent, subunit alpha [Lachnospiraceae bacterium]|nr:L-serine ammonia-lyase, iron-sulfur-dependent, subunit alpha [Lachnospiraceae bacterium]
MGITKELYDAYTMILKKELVPAFGCTEPIAIAYCGAKAKEILGKLPEKVLVEASGNIIKNVKSVIVPNTNGLKGIEAAASAGIVAGNPDDELEVISSLTEAEKREVALFMSEVPIAVSPIVNGEKLDVIISLWAGEHSAKVRIASSHTNIVLIQKDGVTIFSRPVEKVTEHTDSVMDLLTVENIVAYANEVEIRDVHPILERQIKYNLLIAEEGMNNNWGANIGSTIISTSGDTVVNRAKAYAAAGSDARMSGCELPVVINSGSGNQGITVSMPVWVYAKELRAKEEDMYRALIISNLIAIHIKTGIGPLSAYCGAVSAGCAAGCGVAFLYGGDINAIAHTLVNSIAITSGIICDGAKASCAAKIAISVEAGILGYQMYASGQQFYGGDGIVVKGVENTIHNISRLGGQWMANTDKEIIHMMTCD